MSVPKKAVKELHLDPRKVRVLRAFLKRNAKSLSGGKHADEHEEFLPRLADDRIEKDGSKELHLRQSTVEYLIYAIKAHKGDEGSEMILEVLGSIFASLMRGNMHVRDGATGRRKAIRIDLLAS